MSVKGQLKQISAQYRGYLLCESCEGRFSKLGEKWVLANLPKKYGDPYPLQDALAPLLPTSWGNRWERYNVSGVSAFDLEKLIYLGMSIFWRGAVHHWKTNAGQEAPHVDLGAYEEPIRRFLLGTGPFPENMLLDIDVWPYKKVLHLLYPVITEPLSTDVSRYWFHVPGLQFYLFVGTNLPQDARDASATTE